MANGATASPGLSLPRSTFAKLTPAPFLHAHLKQKDPIRPSGRGPDEFREPVVTYGSLTHANGSAVIRVGDTAIVCGVRAEILLASDIANPPKGDAEETLIEDLGLLVPNLELSTGCSPAHLPGNPPSTLAQSLSYRIHSLLHASDLLGTEDLRITYTEPETDEDILDEGPRTVTKAYWTLYIDILCIALDGNPIDAAWAAVLAALKDTKLPKAWWDPDREAIICSPMASDAHKLTLNGLPIASTFSVFSTDSPLKQRSEAQSWVLADPDGFEDDLCRETLTVVLSRKVDESDLSTSGVVRIEKSGGPVVGREAMRKCVKLAEDRWSVWEAALRGG